ncbi:MAG TPA: sugar transferase [Mycobacteriales bacterium]|nr:sugar transferase [Mycobacteriales bacterium]
MPLVPSGGKVSMLTAATKRAVDIALGSVLAVVALPIVAVLAVALGLRLRAFPFFIQQRPGQDGRQFRIMKLRTLPVSTPHYASKLDLDLSALPRFCTWIRRMHLDELPQLFLVPLGDMSLVGPRPRQIDEVDVIDESFDALRRRVRPGCTGLWQVSHSAHLLLNAAPQFDLFYLRYASLRLDIWIMLRTLGIALGFAGPVQVDDVPSWVRGRGLLAASDFIVAYGLPSGVAEDEFVTVGESIPRHGYVVEPAYPSRFSPAGQSNASVAEAVSS